MKSRGKGITVVSKKINKKLLKSRLKLYNVRKI